MIDLTLCDDSLFFEAGAPYVDKNVLTFSLPAGWTCPYRGVGSLSKVHSQRLEGEIVSTLALESGERFTCYSAVMELAPHIYNRRQRNYAVLAAAGDSVDEMAGIISNNIPKDAKEMIVHYSGDFFSENYFKAWMKAASEHPEVKFHAQTTSLGYWVNNRDKVPLNFSLVASTESTQIKLIQDHDLRFSKVVFSKKEADDIGLPFDPHGLIFRTTDKSFAQPLRSGQVAGSEAARAVEAMGTGFTLFSTLPFERQCELLGT
jgi:hypothetical protein